MQTTAAAASAMGPAYITPSIPRKIGKNDKKRKQENNLSGKGHEYTQYGFPNGGKEIGSNRLYAIYKSQKQKDSEIPFREFKIGLASVSKDGNNLPWEKLKAEECQNRN